MFCNNQYRKRIWKRMAICVCVTESLCCTPELTPHCKPTILQYEVKIRLKTWIAKVHIRFCCQICSDQVRVAKKAFSFQSLSDLESLDKGTIPVLGLWVRHLSVEKAGHTSFFLHIIGMKANPQRLGPDMEQHQPGAQSDQTKGEVHDLDQKGSRSKPNQHLEYLHTESCQHSKPHMCASTHTHTHIHTCSHSHA